MEAKPIEKDMELFDERNQVSTVPVNTLPVTSSTPADLLAIAVSQGADMEKLEKLMELQARWEANEARKAYVAAMAKFKENPPEILKDKHVKYTTQKGITEYDHASLGAVAAAIGQKLGENGLSAAWTTQQNGKIRVTCRITHSLGHFEETSLEADADISGSKNSIQAIGSTITYLQRYTLLALAGLAAKGQDDDGKGSDPVVYITEKQLSELTCLADESGADKDQFLKYMEVESLDKIPAKEYNKAKASLNLKLKVKEKKEKENDNN